MVTGGMNQGSWSDQSNNQMSSTEMSWTDNSFGQSGSNDESSLSANDRYGRVINCFSTF